MAYATSGGESLGICVRLLNCSISLPGMNDFTQDQQKAVYDVIRKRRDVRLFKPDPVSDEMLARVLRAAHCAGSVGFMQPWNFIWVRGMEKRRAIWAHVNSERL